jgi:tRNA1(Val) A37 N6-methylase TrmN6
MAEAAGPAVPGDENITHDTLLGGSVPLLQPRRGHRSGTDAVLLAQLADVRGGDVVVDLGSASGAAGLVLARRVPDARIVFVERDPVLVALCRRNIGLNGLDGRAIAVEADLFALPLPGVHGAIPAGDADLVVTNPPFFEEGARASPDDGRAAAHVLRGGDLARWIAAAADLLAAKGRLCLIHRADRFGACLEALRPGFGSVTVRPVHPRLDRPASRIVVSAVKGGRAPLVLAPALVLHAPDGAFTPDAERLHRVPVPPGRETGARRRPVRTQ